MTNLDLGILARQRVRLIRQSEVAECGLACLAMIAGFHGLDIDLATMRRRFGTSTRGASLKSLIGIANAVGLVPRPVKLPLEALGNLHAPAILHWDMNHFVVLDRVSGSRALIHDPAGRSAWMPMAEVSDRFTGVAMELRPAVDFQSADRRERLRLSHLWRRVTGFKTALAQTLVLTLVLQAFVLASPYFMQVAIDTALPALDRDLLAVLAVGFGLFTLINVTASFLRSHVLLSAGAALGFGIAANVARRLFRLPVDWFERRHIGDVLSRFQSVRPIQQALTHGLVAAMVDGVLAITVLLVMFLYSPTLAMVTLTAFTLYAAVRLVTFVLEREAEDAVIALGAKEQSTLIESLRGIVTLRLFAREGERHALWQNRMSDAVNAQLRSSRLGIWQQSANLLLFGLENVIVIWLAVGLIIDGGFSIGMVFAYMAYKGQFTGKATTLIDQIIHFRLLGLHLERLADVALSPEDPSFAQPTASEPADMDGTARFSGAIMLRAVAYRYSPAELLILDQVDLKVEPGEHLAITGPSGGGKSTLLKVLLGLVEPEGGEVLVDGLPLVRYGHARYRSQVAAVMQNDHLFAGSIADNIALFDEKPDMSRIHASAEVAAVHREIMAMPMRYETLVGDMGSTLSGGQKARVLLARALYRQPKLLVMDEGTAHLDAANEAAVNKAIAGLGITRIVVAHRAETIRAADRVLTMIGGKLMDVEKFSRASAADVAA